MVIWHVVIKNSICLYFPILLSFLWILDAVKLSLANLLIPRINILFTWLPFFFNSSGQKLCNMNSCYIHQYIFQRNNIRFLKIFSTKVFKIDNDIVIWNGEGKKKTKFTSIRKKRGYTTTNTVAIKTSYSSFSKVKYLIKNTITKIVWYLSIYMNI